MASFEFPWHSLISYPSGLHLQNHYRQEVEGGHPGYVMGCEHFSVVTLGKRGNIADDLMVAQETLLAEHVGVFTVERGGQATLHNPGQLVIYPILPLNKLGLGVRDYLSLLEEVSLVTLGEFAVEVHRRSVEPGLYAKNGKMVFFGIRIARGISQHGVAMNVANNLDNFSWIRSCGVTEEKFDRVQNYHPQVSTAQVFECWSRNFAKLFH